MRRRISFAVGCLLFMIATAWLGSAESPAKATGWKEISPGIWRSESGAYGYALVDGEHALLIDAPQDGSGLAKLGVKNIDAVLLTHHDRDSVAASAWFIERKIPVRASKKAADWLTPDNVAKYWKDSIPLRNSRTAYFVVPVGIAGIDCSLDDGQEITWRGKTIRVVAAPGHCPDHVAFAVTEKKDAAPIVFCGDALASEGKLWTPYTTDWDHWTDLGLKPTHETLRNLATLKPAVLYPAHGEPIAKETARVLEATAKAVEEVGFLKSFERFSDRIGDTPKYDFLVPKEQIASGGDKPWAKVSEHLYLTGNTYVLLSKEENAFLVVDPWGKRSADQIAKLKADKKLGALEVVWFSHAHYDHYDGVFDLPEEKKPFDVWALDRVAEPLKDPFRMRAPFLDHRPIKFSKTFTDGGTATWREYRFKFHFFPGQTEYTMAVETEIDGKRCLFTADNFFHVRQFSGSGGWMGLNRSYPMPYSTSAQKVLDINPEWVLAEHGGPYVFNAEDYKRRVKWGQVSAIAADAISPSGFHRRDWNPNRASIEPLLFKAKAGATLTGVLKASDAVGKGETLKVHLHGRGQFADWKKDVPIAANGKTEIPFEAVLNKDIPKGRNIFKLSVMNEREQEVADAFIAVEID